MSGNTLTKRGSGIVATLVMIIAVSTGCGAAGDGGTPVWGGPGPSETESSIDVQVGLGPAQSATPSPTPTASTPSPTGSPTSPSRTGAPTRSASPRQTGPWSVVVDNSTPGRFSASSSWGRATNSSQRYGPDFRYATPYTEKSDAAWYKVAIPATGTYRVEVRYPASSGNNDRSPYVVVTASGNTTVHVNQRTNGGRWITLGTFTLTAGDENKVGVSRWTYGTGQVVADAIRVTRVG